MTSPLLRRTTSLLAAFALLATAGSAAQAASPEARARDKMSHAEYRRVEHGMSTSRVTAVAGSNGRVYSSYGDCLIKEWRGWDSINAQQAYVEFHRTSGGFRVKNKSYTGLGEFRPGCPTPM